MMLINLKFFFRYLLRKKLSATINIFGLGIALASVLLLMLYVLDELAFDRQHPDAEAKYRIETILSTGDELLELSSAAAPAVPLLQQNFPEIVATVRYFQSKFHVSTDTDPQGFYEDGFAFADANIGTFFNLGWLRGDPATAFSELNSVVLTESLAQKYFGTDDPLGKTLHIDRRLALVVTGVLEDGLGNTHIEAEAFAPMAALRTLRGDDLFSSWFNLDFRSYVQLAPSADMEQLWPAMAALIEDNMPPQGRDIFSPVQRSLRDIYTGFRPDPTDTRTRADTIRILLGIGFAILAVACINFVNLTIAQSLERQKEIAIRKVAGSGRPQLFIQHMGESLFMVLLASLLALGITELALPVLNSFADKNIALSGNPAFWLSATGICTIVALGAGAYPALRLSAFTPLEGLRQQRGEMKDLLSFRNLLVIFQFSITVVALIGSIVMMLQLQFAKTLELGFDHERVMVLENDTGPQWETFKQLVRQRTGIEHISAALNRPFQPATTAANVRYEGSESAQILPQFMVDFGYFELFDVELLAGRLFSAQYAVDRMRFPTVEQPHPPGSVVLNEAMAQRLGWTPEAALGKRFEMGFDQAFARSVIGEVVGVVANMHVDSVQREVVPQFYYVPEDAAVFDYLFLKLPEDNLRQSIRQVEAVWRELYPQTPINHYLLADKFQQLYLREEKQSALLGLFAMLAIFISCMGLTGLANFATERRIKEIGVRKTIGASVWQIIVLFSVDFGSLVLVSNVIAWPLGYVAMSRWLENFAYRIDLTPMIFIGSGLIALCIAWVTVGGTAAKAATQKPVLALRYE